MVSDKPTLEDSADAKKNAQFVFCHQFMQRRSYATCIKTLNQIEQDGKGAPECSRGVRWNTCPSKLMREEELKAGHAIHFIPRAASPIIKSEYVGEAPKIEIVKPAHKLAPVEMPTYADALNRYVEREAKTEQGQAIETKSPVTVDIRPGESPLEAMKRLKGEK